MRTLIVGATDEGLNLALEVGRRAYADGVIIGFVDDQRALVGRSLAGTRVLGTPDELAGAVLLLAAPKAGSFITGTNSVVDGGFTAMTI